MLKHRLVLRSGLLTILTVCAFVVAERQVVAQGKGKAAGQLRGPQMGGTPLLLPRQAYAPGLLNNGSLQTTQNPNADLPNQVRFIYIAAMPLGDRLGNNGVFYDTDLLPNIGLFQGGQAGMNANPNPMPNPNPNPNPFPPPFPKAARMARQRMMMAMYANYMMQMQAMMQYADPSGFGWYDPNGSTGGYSSPTGANGFGSFATPMNNQGFGTGFQNVGGGF